MKFRKHFIFVALWIFHNFEQTYIHFLLLIFLMNKDPFIIYGFYRKESGHQQLWNTGLVTSWLQWARFRQTKEWRQAAEPAYSSLDIHKGGRPKKHSSKRHAVITIGVIHSYYLPKFRRNLQVCSFNGLSVCLFVCLLHDTCRSSDQSAPNLVHIWSVAQHIGL